MRTIEKLRTFFLIIFIASLPFEYWDPFGVSSFFTITKFLGILYLLFSLFNIPKNFNLRNTEKPVIILLLLWTYLLFQSIFNYQSNMRLSIYNFTFLQNIILFWLLSNDLIWKPNLAPKLFLTFVLGVIAMGILISLGIGIDIGVDDIGNTRLNFFGSNPNGVGNLSAIALFFTIYLIINREKYWGKYTWLLIFAIPLLFNLLSLSGSRGALLIAFAGIIPLFLLQKGGSVKKIVMIFIGMIFIYWAFNSIMESEIMQQRLLLTIQDGSLGGRNLIWKHAFDIFMDYPFLGIGVSGYEYEMIKRMGIYMDTHNLFLYFMVTGGVVGLFLYFGFLSFLIKNCMKYYKLYNDALLIGIFIIYLFSVIKSGGAINSKLFWLLASFIYGLGCISNNCSNNYLNRKM